MYKHLQHIHVLSPESLFDQHLFYRVYHIAGLVTGVILAVWKPGTRYYEQ